MRGAGVSVFSALTLRRIEVLVELVAHDPIIIRRGRVAGFPDQWIDTGRILRRAGNGPIVRRLAHFARLTHRAFVAAQDRPQASAAGTPLTPA